MIGDSPQSVGGPCCPHFRVHSSYITRGQGSG